MNNLALAEKLEKHAGIDLSDSDIVEMLKYESTKITAYGHDSHRWYTLYNQVVKIGDMFIDFETYSNEGDEDAMCGEGDKMVLKSAVEVFPKEVTVTKYVKEDEL